MIGSVGMSGAAYTGYVYMGNVGKTPNPQAAVNPVEPVRAVPEVFSNENTKRVNHSPEEMETYRRVAFDKMKADTPRDANNPNGNKITDEFEEKLKKQMGIEKCETCENRKYVDGSNESNVSFKSAAHIDPEAAASVVAAHEREHVANAVNEGNKPDADLVSATVTLKTDTCPECGKTYVSGGVTKTVMRRTTDGTELEDSSKTSKTKEELGQNNN